MYENKTLICKDCGNEFDFTAGEQEFYAEKGFTNEPQRCKSCRDARKQTRDDASRTTRELFELHVLNVAAHVKFHFNLATIVLFIAVIALQIKDKCALVA